MTSPSFQIAIPSYRRSRTLATMTMPLLLSRGVPPEIIRVWTTGEAEADVYREALSMFIDADQVQPHGGAVGVGNARNAVISQYPAGTRLLQVDDDLKQIHRKIDEEKRSNFGKFTEKGAQPVKDLVGLVEAGFDLADEEGVSLWSTYPVKNPFYMGFRSRVGNLYAEGSFRAMTLRHDGTELVTLDDKEDFEQSIKHYLRDGGVLRLENYGFISSFYTEGGGMQEYRTRETVRRGALDLLVMYPELCRPRKPFKTYDDMPEVRLFPQHARRARMIEVA